MPKIEKLPSGSYRVRVMKNGKSKSFTAETKTDVKRLAAEYLCTEEKEESGMTIKQAVEEYINNRTSVNSPSTIRGYRQIQRNYFGNIENFSIDTITSEDIQREINRWSASLSPKSVRNIYGLLISSITAFLPDKAIKVTMPQKNVVKRHIQTDEEVRMLLEAADDELKKAILLAAMGTLRRGEIAAIRYKDIQGNTIHVHADIVKGEDNTWVYKEIPKTNASDRYVEYPNEVIKAMGDGEPEEYVVKVDNPNIITQRYIRIRNKIGIDCRFHDLRHYAASIMHAIGIPDQYIMECGGWSSDSILKSVYRNILDDKKDEFTAQRTAYMQKLLGESVEVKLPEKKPVEKKPKKKRVVKERNGRKVDHVPNGYVRMTEYCETHNVARNSLRVAMNNDKIRYVVCDGIKYVDNSDNGNFRIKRTKEKKYPSTIRPYHIWQNMKKRCTNPNFIYYHRYGGRGIKVCEEWLNDPDAFIDWAYSHGYRDDLEIDRIDNDGDYCPDNCRWVTRSKNVKKRRSDKRKHDKKMREAQKNGEL